VTTYGLLDTSVLIAREQHRLESGTALPDEVSVSVVTLAELQLGVYAARDTETRARRMATLDGISGFDLLPIDADAATEWSRLRYRLAEVQRRVNVNDLWIAAIALANGLPIVTQDADFSQLEGLGGPAVIRI
jgi:predicted nucleic acid-binding protein